MPEDYVNFSINERTPNIIKVIGVGGGGSNAVKSMYNNGVHGVDFVICNTDIKALTGSKVNSLQIGEKLTGGYGAGNDPKDGALAAQESIKEIEQLFTDNIKMVFVTAAMGGGTGSGAAPIIAKVAKDKGILTVGVVSIPIRKEGPKRLNSAREGLKKMKESVDSLIVIDSEQVSRQYPSEYMSEAFKIADDILRVAVKGVAEIITLPGYINVDFADVKAVIQDSGVAVMGSYSASGEGRALTTVQKSLESPLLNNNDVKGAKKIMFNITYGTEEIRTDELTEITDYIMSKVGDESFVIWGIGEDDSLGDAIAITVIATNFDNCNIEIDDLVKKNNKESYVVKLRHEDVRVYPDLNLEEVGDLIKNPAYQRRKIRIN